MDASFERAEPFASGGTCELFRARSSLGVRGVWKQLHASLRNEPSVIAHLQHEATLLSLSKHRNVVALLARGMIEDTPYLVLEELPGPSLASLRSQGPLPLRTWLAVASALLQALTHLHELCDAQQRWLQVVHRDVSPDNLLLHPERGPVLIDLGLACSVLLPEERDGTLRGTPGYLAPEAVLQEEAIDARADVFSAAVVLHELSTGQRLFPGGSLDAANAVVSTAIPAPLLPAELSRALLQALERDRNKRTPSARALLDALKQAVKRSPS